MTRLSDASLGLLAPSVGRPDYDRSAVSIGIVHLGLGAFHRAHLAAYVDACLSKTPEWGICGVSLRSPATRDGLAPQDGLYTMGVQSAAGLEPRVLGALKDLVVAPDDPAKLIACLASPDVKIVSLTVTEKGYCRDPATGRLDATHPDIVHDVACGADAESGYPRSAIGWLWAGLVARRAAGLGPFTILCCDNLPSNGATVRQVLLDYAGLKDPDLVAWAEEALACPSTMVDRIVPATQDADKAEIAKHIGLEDAWPVLTEPFSQFVVEDHFPLARPPWDAHGVTMARDVEPFEKMKLRMLNGSHSTLAYLGQLAGDETVADTMAEAPFRTLIHDLMTEEVMPTLTMPDGVDLPAYRDALLHRFSNPALRHRTYQIAMDGSQKLPQRLLGTVRDRLAGGHSFDRLALGVAAWMRFATGRREGSGEPYTVQDPMAERFADLAAAARVPVGGEGAFDAKRLAEGFFGLRAVFGEDLPRDDRFTASVVRALERLCQDGARATIAYYAG
ncbi:MAG: mannitol dehydrogenase family protein [Devosiaceae bacterium]|nr:mannitol dehydrogenase family protein [Devosiaceae bacterium MH13]